MQGAVKWLWVWGCILPTLALAACGNAESEPKTQARAAFEAAVAKDTDILAAVPLPSDATAAQAQQAFAALATELSRFKGEIEVISYPDNARADAARFETDLSTQAAVAQRISSGIGQAAGGTAPPNMPSQAEFCDAITQAVRDANAVFNDLQSNQQYRAPRLSCA